MRGASDDPTDLKTEADRLKEESDKCRIQFLTAELDLCFTFASLAEGAQKRGHQEPAERALADAEIGYATLSRYLADPKHVAGISLKQHREFRTELQRLRRTLDEVHGVLGEK